VTAKKYDPNKDIESALKKLLEDSVDQPFDMRCKALNTAISWEKTKNAILDNADSEYDPESY
jgi:hypothetical protein